MIALGSKKQSFDTDPYPKQIQQIIVTRNLDLPENTTMFFILEEVK